MARSVAVTIESDPNVREDKQTARIGRVVGEPVERFCARAQRWGWFGG